MSQSLAKNLLHLVFSTKHREPYLSASRRPAIHAYLAGIFREWESPALRIGGVDDHVHILFQLHKTLALSKIVEEVKKGSSKWIKTQAQELSSFYWQNGYGAFSVSQSNVEAVIHYIDHQEDHHRRVTFQEEFREFLRRHEIEYDERYVWD